MVDCLRPLPLCPALSGTLPPSLCSACAASSSAASSRRCRSTCTSPMPSLCSVFDCTYAGMSSSSSSVPSSSAPPSGAGSTRTGPASTASAARPRSPGPPPRTTPSPPARAPLRPLLPRPRRPTRRRARPHRRPSPLRHHRPRRRARRHLFRQRARDPPLQRCHRPPILASCFLTPRSRHGSMRPATRPQPMISKLPLLLNRRVLSRHQVSTQPSRRTPTGRPHCSCLGVQPSRPRRPAPAAALRLRRGQPHPKGGPRPRRPLPYPRVVPSPFHRPHLLLEWLPCRRLQPQQAGHRLMQQRQEPSYHRGRHAACRRRLRGRRKHRLRPRLR